MKDHEYDFEMKQQIGPYSDPPPVRAARCAQRHAQQPRTGTGSLQVGLWPRPHRSRHPRQDYLRGLQMSSILAARLALSIANAEDWPAVQMRTDAEVREAVGKAGFLERAVKTGYLPELAEDADKAE